MDNELKTLLDEQLKTFEDFKSENNKRIDETKKLGAEQATTRQNVENLNKSLDDVQLKIKNRIDKLEAALNNVGMGGGSEGDYKDALIAAEVKKYYGQDVSPQGVREYRNALDKWLRRGDGISADFRNALQVGADPDGGYWVLPDTTGRMVKKIYESSPIRPIAAVQAITTDALEGINDNGEASAGWVAETAARSATNTPQVGKWRIPVHEMYANPQATQQLLDDAIINVEQWITDKMGEKFARLEATAFVTGDGAGKPKGFTVYPTATTADATRAWGTVQYIFSGAAADFASSNPSDKLIDMVSALKQGYRQGAVWVTNKAIIGDIRKFKDGQGLYLWQPNVSGGQSATLLGFPIVEAEDMPAKAANAYGMAFGNFAEAYQIVDRAGMSVLRDPYSNKPYVGFYAKRRVGGAVINSEAYKLLKFATS